MQRKTIDFIASLVGLGIVLVLFIGGGLLMWAYDFAHGQVKNNLAAQQITFPNASDPSVADAKYANVRKYGGQQLTTGAQAKVYANNYIKNHIAASTGGKTYSEVSGEFMKYSKANPTANVANDAQYRALYDTRMTAFMGESLRGVLLNAYAFDTMANIARIAAIVAFISGAAFLILSILGFAHSKKQPEVSTIVA